MCYQVGPLGPNWRFLRKERHQVAFFNDKLPAVIQGNATCRDDAEAASLRNLTDQLFIGYTEKKIQSEQLVPLAEREALRTVALAKLDGVPMVLDLYVLKRNGCIFDFAFSAPPDRYAQGREDFEHFVAGFNDERHS